MNFSNYRLNKRDVMFRFRVDESELLFYSIWPLAIISNLSAHSIIICCKCVSHISNGPKALSTSMKVGRFPIDSFRAVIQLRKLMSWLCSWRTYPMFNDAEYQMEWPNRKLPSIVYAERSALICKLTHIHVCLSR